MRVASAKLVLVAALALSMAVPTVVEARNGEKTAAVIGGLLLGAAALAASSHDHRYQNQYYVAPPPPAYYRRPVAPFSPARGVICYPREGACYDDAGDFMPAWTNRVF